MSIATTPEPPPSGGHGPSIHDLVIADVEQRKALDLAVYLRQEIAKRVETATRIDDTLAWESTGGSGFMAKRDGWIARVMITVVGWRWSVTKGFESYQGAKAFAGESGEGWAKREAAHALARAMETVDV